MAISYYTGIPRSGKTLKAVALIYETFVAPKIPKKGFLDKALEKAGLDKKIDCPYENCYTNINQFNYEIDERIKPFDFNVFLAKLQILHAMYLNKANDDVLNEKAKELEIYKSLFVIDECHNFLSKKDEALIWWVTYHGHLFHDIIMITQNLSLVLKDYTTSTEYFYKAIPQRFRFSKNTFKYVEYSGRELYKNQKLGIVSLKVKPEYFNLYVSGAEKKDKPIIYKYILFLLFLVAIAFFSFYRFTSSIAETTGSNENQSQQNQNITSPGDQSQQNQNINSPGAAAESKQLKLFKFTCYENFCYYKINNKTTEIPIKILTQYVKDKKDENMYLEQKGKKANIYLLDDPKNFPFMEFTTGEDDKKDSSMNLINTTTQQ
ncbi:zonula occludens toxin (Zot) family protein [Aliarcobacter cibarius]|uniref:zonular occludens toxin domain-containing protein n=1 Tax=Aliarcobacter cibarius TaxID=255507 RepID=UPI00124657D9|nr:zonular occludens toxin domain-containing protein [Aliarcobacter cibarius]QEZ89067.1 zonula occludens toxin (Zot) family protein [Aliarcobacter cibarius]